MPTNLKKRKWEITKINQDYQMTRIYGDYIECRDLRWFEKVLKWMDELL